MNIIRTKSVELSTIPAIAYRQKLPTGGAGIKLLRLDQDASAVATIDKRSGEALPYGKTDPALFPAEAFDEALELVAGMPYSTRGNIRVTPAPDEPEPQQEEEAAVPELPDMVDSDEYKAIIERYSDERGRLNYALMNKDFIQFAAKSKTASDMAAQKAPVEDILLFVVKSRSAFIAGKKDSLDNPGAMALIATLDEIDPRSAFKELKAYLNRMLARG